MASSDQASARAAGSASGILAMSDYGPTALLVDVAPGCGATWAAAVRRELAGTVTDTVVAETSVLVEFASRDLRDLGRVLLEGMPLRPPQFAGNASARPEACLRTVVIPVRYDGPDLVAVAASTGMSVEAVVALHSEAAYRVAFFGFAPGFAYLTGLPRRLQVPRRNDPRPHVTAGSVAIAAGYSAVYPSDSPGGWHLLGHTELAMFDPDASPPTPLDADCEVRFDAV